MLSYLDIISYLVIGLLAGATSGLLGVGAGIVVVPCLVWLFNRQGFSYDIIMHLAAGSSLASILFSSLASGIAHNRYGTVIWPVVYKLLPGIIIGSLSGTLIGNYLPTQVLQFCFGLFMVFIGLRMLFVDDVKATEHTMPKSLGLFLVGAIISMQSSLLGISGGSLMIPFMSRCNIAMRNASGTAIVCTIPIALLSTLIRIIIGWNEPSLPILATGYVFWPAVVGVALTSIIAAPFAVKVSFYVPQRILKRLFAMLLLAIAVSMLYH